MLKSFKKNQKGFTLVELMVVVVIIGILTAIAVPVYNSVTTKAERSAIEANLRTIDGVIMTATATEDKDKVDTEEKLLDLLKKDYLPNWPDDATYGVTGTYPKYEATVTGTAKGGLDSSQTYKLTDLP